MIMIAVQPKLVIPHLFENQAGLIIEVQDADSLLITLKQDKSFCLKLFRAAHIHHYGHVNSGNLNIFTENIFFFVGTNHALDMIFLPLQRIVDIYIHIFLTLMSRNIPDFEYMQIVLG